MRFVDRSKVKKPAILDKPYDDEKTELDRAIAHYADPSKTKSYAFNRYRHAEVKEQLFKLFHGKCAYCETNYTASQPVDVEHYRPKSKVKEDKNHEGYWWLAMDWDNLLPSCADCNRVRHQPLYPEEWQARAKEISAETHAKSGKATSFPLEDNNTRKGYDARDEIEDEKRLLLNPCLDNPEEHLDFYVDRTAESPLSFVRPKQGSMGEENMGSMSIATYGLNRLGLVQDRARLVRRLQMVLEMLISMQMAERRIQKRLDEIVDENDPDHAVHQQTLKALQRYQHMLKDHIQETASPQSPYSAVVKAWLRAYKEDLEQID